MGLLASMSAMPLLQIQASVSSAPNGLLQALSRELGGELRKPERYVMVSFQSVPQLLFGGEPGPACFAVLKNVGTFTPAQTKHLSALLCKRLSEGLGVAADRIYLEFVSAQGYLWGHDGDTFDDGAT